MSNAKEIYARVDNVGNRLDLYINGKAYETLREALHRALNTWDSAPAWLFKLENDMKAQPVPDAKQSQMFENAPSTSAKTVDTNEDGVR